jgi:DNA-binding NtrC family response regulator
MKQHDKKETVRSSGNKIYIIHLEDDVNDQELVSNTLKKNGASCEISTVSDRKEFITALKDKKYTLVLSDYNLAHFDGLSALKIVRNKRPDLPFIMLSGSVGEELAVEILKHGATDFVLKDNLEKLPGAIERAIKLQQEMQKRKIVEQALYKSEEQLQHRHKELVEIEKLKSVKELAGAICHEFSQPLQILTNYLGIMECEIGNNKYLKIFRDNVKRIIELTAKLRNITLLKTKGYLDELIIDIEASSFYRQNNGQLKILIVDDEPDVLKSLIEIFELYGWKCKGVKNADDALALFQQDKFDIVLSDIMMPVIFGPEFFMKLRKLNKTIPFIFLTGYEISKVFSKIVKKADHILRKPVSVNELLKVVHHYTHRPEIDVKNDVSNPDQNIKENVLTQGSTL